MKEDCTEHFLYIALVDSFFQCITFSLLESQFFCILLNTSFTLKGFFCLVQFLMLFSLSLSACFCMDLMGLRCILKAQLLIRSGNLAGNCQVLSTPRRFNGKFQLDCVRGVLILFKLLQLFLIISEACGLLPFQVQIQNPACPLIIFSLMITE